MKTNHVICTDSSSQKVPCGVSRQCHCKWWIRRMGDVRGTFSSQVGIVIRPLATIVGSLILMSAHALSVGRTVFRSLCVSQVILSCGWDCYRIKPWPLWAQEMFYITVSWTLFWERWGFPTSEWSFPTTIRSGRDAPRTSSWRKLWVNFARFSISVLWLVLLQNLVHSQFLSFGRF